jgi:hypothetical protein
VTLRDAADYIMKLPKAEQDLEEWQAAVEALIMAAEGAFTHRGAACFEPKYRTRVN